MWRFCICFLFCCALLCVFLVLQPFEEDERADYFAIIVLGVSYNCKCSAALPHGAVGWSVVCDCGIF